MTATIASKAISSTRLGDKARNRLQIQHPTCSLCEANASLAIALPRRTFIFEPIKGVKEEQERKQEEKRG